MSKDALAVALHFLKFRPRSVFEVEKKLKQKRILDSEIQKTISVLKKNKLLDDQKFAKMWVESRNNLKPSGSYVLKMELRKLGVAAQDIEEAMKEQDEESLAKQALEMKYREREIEYEKKVGFLARRGFKTSVIYRVIKR